MMRLASTDTSLTRRSGYQTGMLFQRRDAENAEEAQRTHKRVGEKAAPVAGSSLFLVLSWSSLLLSLRSLRLCVELTLPSYDLQKIPYNFQPHGPGLLGVELDAVHVAAFERGGVTDVVGAGGAGTGVFGHVVAVREVHVRAGVEVANEFGCGAHLQLVASHVGNARDIGEAAHGAGVDAETADFRGLFAGIEQRLHAEADAEKGHAGLNAFDQRRAHAQRIQGAHHLAEMAHSGENDFGSSREAGGVVDNGVVAAQFAKGVLHAAQIARAVIEDGNHKSSLVEGSCPLRRASLEQANFMARAKHLKMASSLWWLERPYNTLACRLAPA